MIILKQCERICIVADEEDIMNGKQKIMIMFNNQIFDGSNFSCISNPEAKPLFSHLQKEYTESYLSAKDEFKRLEKIFSKSPATPRTRSRRFQYRFEA